MARFQTKYTCQSCGYESPKWLGKCPECEAWDSLVEEVNLKEKGGGSGKDSTRQQGFLASHNAPIPITQVTAIANSATPTTFRRFPRSARHYPPRFARCPYHRQDYCKTFKTTA